DRKAQLRGIEVLSDIGRDRAADWQAEARNTEVGVDADRIVLALHAVVCAEEPQAVFHDVAAGVRAKVIQRARIADAVECLRNIRSERRVRAKSAARVEAED